ncbi:hypothetical protein [Photobacterium leiognathi]|uniref:hypothetical protein n=1 Tax=Photobacterium leiognathi TaxID=553611 RepID=UPI00298204EA|nr:hypothetical protein [Photobacterium leiognathi]
MKIIAVTGSVGVVAWLFSQFMVYVFSNEIINFLGSEKIFYITVSLTSIFAISLFISLIKSGNKNDRGNSSDSEVKQDIKKNISLTYNKSKHNGDNHF